MKSQRQPPPQTLGVIAAAGFIRFHRKYFCPHDGCEAPNRENNRGGSTTDQSAEDCAEVSLQAVRHLAYTLDPKARNPESPVIRIWQKPRNIVCHQIPGSNRNDQKC